MRWFAPSSPRADPVRVLQQGLAESEHLSWDAMFDALDVILEEELWQIGLQFDCFAEFAIGLQPAGLGVRTLRPLKLLRYALLANGYFAPWTELLERVARQPGRPRKTLVNDEGFQRFYTIPTAATARDRLLLALKRHHPEHFAAVCDLEGSPREAGIRTGLIRVGGWYYGGVCDIAAAAQLRERAQARLLCELFEATAPSAQCTFIAREIEPRLEAGLAQRWRNSGP
jgi:hypothetical protein